VPLVVAPLAYSRTVRSLAVSVMPGMVSSRSSHTPSVGSLFSRYPSRLAWSRRGLLIRLTWVRCSRGICHAWHCLIVVFSHTLRGFVVLYGVGGRSAGSRVERGRSVERDNMRLQSIVLYTTGNMCSSSPYHPHGASIFPFRRECIRTKETEFQHHERHTTETFEQRNTPTVQRKFIPVHPSPNFLVSFV